MSLIAIGVEIGSPNTASEVPITTSNIAADIAQAVVDLATLATSIAAVVANATTADNDVAVVVTDLTTVAADALAADNDVGTVQTDNGLANTAFDTFAAAVIAITGDTYTSATKQFAFGGATGLTHAQWATVGALLNNAMAEYVTAQAALATAKTATALVRTDVTTAQSAAGAAKTATALVKTNATALSTATVAADLAAAAAPLADADVFVQADTGDVPNVATLNAALVSALTYARDAAILPT